MENKYYKDVRFPELEEAEEEKKDTTDPLVGVDITVQMTEIRRMVQACETGQSTIVSHALILNNSPVLSALQRLENSPSAPGLFEFLDLAKQDINMRFRRECVLILRQHDKLRPLLEGRDDA